MKILRLLLFLFLVPSIVHSQKKDAQTIDSLLNLSLKYRFKDDLQSLNYAEKAHAIARDLYNEKLILKTQLHVADCLYYSDMNDISLEYLCEAEKKVANRYPLLRAELKEIKAKNYVTLGLNNLEIKEFDEIIKILSSIHTEESKKIKCRVYIQMSRHYWLNKDFVKADNYINKAIALSKNFPPSKKIDAYIRKAYICLDVKKDSAYYFIQKTFEEHKKKKDSSSRYELYALQGDYYYQNEKFGPALTSYSKALEDMKNFHMKDIQRSMLVKKNMYKIYGKMNDSTHERKYLNAYQKDLNLYNKRNNAALKETVDLVLTEESLKKTDNRYKSLFVSAGLLLIAGCYFYFRNHTMLKKKRIIEKQKENLLDEKNKLEEQKKSIHEDSKTSKLNQLTELAKTNNPEFVLFFEELYPDFIQNLKKLNPKIRHSEIFFCGMAFLNFSTKDIANYTFVTISAVQLRKHRIRKKYSIPSDVDFNSWMRSLNTSDQLI